MKRLELSARLFGCTIIVLVAMMVVSCLSGQSQEQKADLGSSPINQISELLLGNTNVLLFASLPGVTRAQRHLSLIGLVNENEKEELLRILANSSPDVWIYVSCHYYLKCGPHFFGIYIHPSENEVGFDWTNFDALSTDATDAHNIFVCKDPTMVRWINDFVTKSSIIITEEPLSASDISHGRLLDMLQLTIPGKGKSVWGYAKELNQRSCCGSVGGGNE